MLTGFTSASGGGMWPVMEEVAEENSCDFGLHVQQDLDLSPSSAVLGSPF